MQHRPMYIPTDEEIEYLNHIDTNMVYNYLVTKSIEKLILEAKFLRDLSMPVLTIDEVVHGVCFIFPEEIYASENDKYDVTFCHQLLTRKPSIALKKLNSLHTFAPSVQYNTQIMQTTIDLLDQELVNDPKYRFTYTENLLLNAIFAIDYEKFISLSTDYLLKLIKIDPSYALKFPDLKDRDYFFKIGMEKYQQRFDLTEDNQCSDENTKKLIKYLHSK